MQLISQHLRTKPSETKSHRISKEASVRYTFVPTPTRTFHFRQDTSTHAIAVELAEHIDIVKESRSLIKERKTITWEKFKEKYASPKNK